MHLNRFFGATHPQIEKADLSFVSSPCLQALKESGNVTQISEFQEQSTLIDEIEELDAVFVSKFSSQVAELILLKNFASSW